jgi:hypothetical protein
VEGCQGWGQTVVGMGQGYALPHATGPVRQGMLQWEGYGFKRWRHGAGGSYIGCRELPREGPCCMRGRGYCHKLSEEVGQWGGLLWEEQRGQVGGWGWVSARVSATSCRLSGNKGGCCGIGRKFNLRAAGGRAYVLP